MGDGLHDQPRALEEFSRAYDFPGLRTVDGMAEIPDNYPSRGGVGERAAWFKDSEGNLLAIGQPIRRA